MKVLQKVITQLSTLMLIHLKIICLFVILSIIQTRLCAQNSVVQSSEGETSIVTSTGKSVNLNFASSEIEFSYGQFRSRNQGYIFNSATQFYGLTGSFGTNEGVSTLFKNRNFTPKGDFGGYYGLKWNGSMGKVSTGYIVVKGEASKLNLISANDELVSYNDENFNVKIGFNRLNGWRGKSKDESGEEVIIDRPWIFGVSLKLGQTNNLSELKEETVSNVYFNANNTLSFQSNSKTAYRGEDDFDSNIFFSDINLDWIFIPNSQKRYAFVIYDRLSFEDVDNNQWKNDMGLGVLLNKEGAPREFVGGIHLEFGDIFNLINEENIGEEEVSFSERIVVNLVVGYPF